MSGDRVQQLAAEITNRLIEREESVAVAESCTGGGILFALTSNPGSSKAVWGGIVSYSINAKTSLLEVDPVLVESNGVVSETVAKAMAWGMRIQSGAEWTIAVTGLAGPGGGTQDLRVGTVWIAWYGPELGLSAKKFVFNGNRDEVRKSAIFEALQGLQSQLDREPKASLY